MKTRTIDPEIRFEVKRGLTLKGYLNLYSEENVKKAIEAAEILRSRPRGINTLAEVYQALRIDLWLRSSSKNYHNYLVQIIIENN